MNRKTLRQDAYSREGVICCYASTLFEGGSLFTEPEAIAFRAIGSRKACCDNINTI